jgi:hypothetical protein
MATFLESNNSRHGDGAPSFLEFYSQGLNQGYRYSNITKRSYVLIYLVALTDIVVWRYVLYMGIKRNCSALGRLHQQGLAQDALYRHWMLFGFGWFFEWEGGRHPLNSTWPRSSVRPSTLVLWEYVRCLLMVL